MIKNSAKNKPASKSENLLGLKAFELSLYHLLLESSPRSVIELSGQLGVSRVRTYQLLESLIENGLALKRGSAFFASDPAALYQCLEQQEQEIANQKQILKNLAELHNKTRIKIFRKESGLKLLNDELHKEESEQGYIALNGDFLPKFLDSRRSKEKKHDNIIVNFTNSTEKGRSSARNKGTVFLPYRKQRNFSALSIFGSRVALYSIFDF